MRKCYLLIFAVLLVSMMSFSVIAEEDYWSGIDLEGETVTLLSWFGFDGWGDDWLAEAEAKFNCKIDVHVVGWGDIPEAAINRLIAGDSDYDIWLMPHDHALKVLPQGALLPINEHAPADWYETQPETILNIMDVLEVRGNKYALGWFNDPFQQLEFIVYNKDIFERDALPDLQELYKANEWTWEKMEEIAIEATEKDADGNVTQWGLGYTDIREWVLANDASYTEDRDGRLVFSLTDEEALYAINKVYEWKEVLGISGGVYNDFYAGNTAMQVMRGYSLEEVKENIENWAVVPMPKGPNADEHKTLIQSLEQLFLPNNVAEPEKMLAVVDFFTYNQQSPEESLQNVANHVVDRDSAQILYERLNSPYTMAKNIGIVGPIISDAVTEIMNGEKTAAAAINEVAPTVQAEIDELYEQ